MVWSYVLLAYASLFALGLADNLRGPLFPEILEAFALNDTRGSWIFALSSGFGVVGGLSSRWLLRRWDRVEMLNISLLCLAIGLAGMGAAPTFGWMLVACAFFGFALGLMGVSQNVLATLSAPAHLRSRVLAGLHSMYGLSSFLAPLVVATLVPWWGSWRAPLLAAAGVPLFLMVVNLLARVREHAHLKEQGSHRNAAAGAPDRLAQAWLAGALALYVLAEIMVSSRLALYMRREHGADLATSSGMVTSFFLCLLGGRLLSSLIRWPGSLRTQLLASLLASIVCLVLGLLGWPWGFVLSGLAMAPFYPVAVAYLAEEFPHHLDSAMGVSITLQSALVVSMHLSVGLLTDLYGLRTALTVGPAAMLIATVLLVTYPRRVVAR
jgi:fucose permease